MARFWPHNTVRLFAPENRGTDLCILAVGYDDFTDPAITPICHLRSYNCYTLHFVLEGKGHLHVNGQSHTVEKNALFFTPYRRAMAYYPYEDDPWEYVFFNFHGDQAASLLAAMGLTLDQPVLHDVPHVALRQLVEQLLHTMQESENQPYYRALSVFYELVHLCSRGAQPKGAAQARYMIDMNYASPDFTVDQLCRDLHISHSHLCRLFKETYGTTAVRYLIDRRLQHARHLLTETELPIKAIAYSCGFSDELHFMKSFKAATAMTAREYRKAKSQK